MNVRAELRRLILDGLCGRTLGKLYEQLAKALAEYGDDISWFGFRHWVRGEKFPSTWQRQMILADVVGGPCGEAIAKLQAPSFRQRRAIIRKESEMKNAGNLGSRVRHARMFPYTSVLMDDGRREKQARITCATCGSIAQGRRGNDREDQQMFERMGWEVGRSAVHDVCPACVAARKVVKMSDHVKQPDASAIAKVMEAQEASAMTKEESRIISRLIDDHWDVGKDSYQPGWSDKRMADEAKRPVAWIKAVRERDFGGSGDDPAEAAEKVLAELVAIRSEMLGLGDMMAELKRTGSELAAYNAKHQELLAHYKQNYGAVASRIEMLERATSQRPFKAAS